MNWLDLLAVQGTLKSLLQHHSSKASILRFSAFFTVQLSHLYMTTGKTTALTRWTFVGKVMSLLLNMLSRLVITFLPRNKRLLISWLQSPSAVILEPSQNKIWHSFHCFLNYFHEVMGPDAGGWKCSNWNAGSGAEALTEWRGTKKPLDESKSGEWKSWLKAQHSENEDHGIRSHHFNANRWGNSGKSVRFYFGELQKSLQMVIAAMKLKDAYSLEEKLWST